MVQSEKPQVKVEEEKRERFDSFLVNKLWIQSIKKKKLTSSDGNGFSCFGVSSLRSYLLAARFTLVAGRL